MNITNMRESSLILGLGQCGGNFGEGFLKFGGGYNVMAINSSIGDLNTLKLVTQKHLLEGSEGQGSNHDRAKSLSLFKKNLPILLNSIFQNVTEKIRNIFVIGASGGGTASGGIALLSSAIVSKIRILGLQINVSVVLVLPSLTESFKAQYNTYYCIEDIKKISSDIGAIFLLDNNQVKNKLSINDRFIKQLSAFLDIPSNDSSITKTIDVNEITEVLSARKIAMITMTNDKKQNVPGDILKSLTSNIYTPLEESSNRFGFLTLSLANNNLSSDNTVLELKKTVGQSIDDYVTYNKRSINICCLSGLPFPEKRLNSIFNTIKASSSDIEELLSSKIEVSNKDDKLKNLFRSPDKSIKKVEDKSESELLDELMSRF